MKNKFSFLVIFIAILGEILYPYAINNTNSILASITSVIYFFSLPLLAYYLGKQAKEDRDNYYLIFAFIFINSIFWLINRNNDFNILEPFFTTKMILCYLVWKNIAKFFNKKIFIIISGIFALLIGFIDINSTLALNYLIGLFPFFLIGYQFDFEFKFKRKIKTLLGIILTIGIIYLIYYLLSHFFISYDILLLNAYTSNKHLIFRCGYFFISMLVIIALNLLFDTHELNNKCLLYSYIFIPIFNLIFNHFVDLNFYSNYYILLAFLFALIITMIFNNDMVGGFMKKIFTDKNMIVLNTFLILLMISTLIFTKVKVNTVYYPIYDKVDSEHKEEINNSISISFVGDLIMLENQVKAGFNGKEYNYDKMFSYVKSYFNDSDYTIGVLEGPVANGKYTVGNFDDGKALYLNFPKAFLNSIKASGIDFVTVANNHLLDMGITGADDTVKALDEINLPYVGYKDDYKIVDIKGLKVGILAYTYGTNYYSEDALLKLGVTKMIVEPSSKNFNKVKESVINDFNNLKKENVDLIIVLPHMGTQFWHKTDVMQNTWNKIFAENGASIVFGDHSHAVQPIEYLDNTIIVNSPGNFANQYYKYDGDATAIVEVYIDADSKKVISSSVVPMFTKGDNDGFYYSIPIYEIMHNSDLYNSISFSEMNRIKEVQKLITKVMLNEEIDIDNTEKKYYLFKDGYKRSDPEKLEINKSLENKEIYKELSLASSVCFLGDSVTEGTRNGGYGWYEPLVLNFNLEVKTAAYGSYTTKLLLKNKVDQIKSCSSDLNIIAIGTNDIRYRDNTSAMTKEEYITNIEKIVSLIKSQNKNAKFVFIAPWYSMDHDTVTPLSLDEKEKLFNEYINALNDYSISNNYLFINANDIIKNEINSKISSYYMVDYIHPNRTNGIYLYSKAVLEASK